jgi:ankyrin repeat protein
MRSIVAASFWLLVVAPASAQESATAKLFSAAREGRLPELERLLADGVDPSLTGSDFHETALMLASAGNHIAVAHALIQAGAKVDAKDALGDPAINWAAYYGSLEYVSLLLAAGADWNVVTQHGNALQIALRRGHRPIASLIAERGGIELSEPPLMEAARRGDAEAVRRMLGEGAAPDDSNEIGFTALLEAAREGHLDVVRALLDAGADVAHHARPEGMAMTALHRAADGKRLDVASLLVERGAQVDASNATDTTPLLWALYAGAEDVALVLLERGADPSRADRDGYSAQSMREQLSPALQQAIDAALGRATGPG